MKQITHEEARKEIERIENDFNINFLHLRNYISQQEKKDKLLELYRNQNYHVMQGNIIVVNRIQEKIKALEEELK